MLAQQWLKPWALPQCQLTVAVQAFVEGRLSFPGIWQTVEKTLASLSPRDYKGCLDIILEDDALAREAAARIIGC